VGFESPSQLVQDAKRRGVVVLPVDVTISGWDSSLEGAKLSRLVMRLTFPSLAVHVLQADVVSSPTDMWCEQRAGELRDCSSVIYRGKQGQQSLHRLDGEIRT
jgi:DNA polymerase III alpha subunit